MAKAKNAAPVAPAAPKAPKIEQNDVIRPSAGTKTARVWEIADALSDAAKAPAPRKDVLAACTAEAINEATAATQYGKWRKFHGLGKEVKEAAPAAPVAEAAAPVAPAAE